MESYYWKIIELMEVLMESYCWKKYRIMNDLKDASTGATCLECLFNIYQEDISALLIVNIVLEIKKHS